MFWGLIMEPEKRYTQVVKKAFHISMAALDSNNADNKPTQIMCTNGGRNYLLCTLSKEFNIQTPLDLNFAVGDEISFAANGKSYVHLTGYIQEDIDDYQDEEDQEAEDEEIDEVEELPTKKRKKKVIEEPKKKAKQESDSDESDDENYNAEESVDESDDDEEDDDEEEDDEEEEVKQPSAKKQNGIEKSKKPTPESKVKSGEKQSVQKKTIEGGVIIEDLKVGNGQLAKAGKSVNVYYIGRLKTTNKVFDQTTKGPGFKFRVGNKDVIKGWDVGIPGMKVGGKRRITVPASMAYGSKGAPPAIPPNSTLVFEVDLKNVH